MGRKPARRTVEQQRFKWGEQAPAPTPTPPDDPSALEAVALTHPVVQEVLRLFGGRIVSVRRWKDLAAAGAQPGQARGVQQPSLWPVEQGPREPEG